VEERGEERIEERGERREKRGKYCMGHQQQWQEVGQTSFQQQKLARCNSNK